MKHLFKTAIVVAVIAASFISLSAFVYNKKATAVDAYQIVLISKNTVGSNVEWTWALTNPNPGNGSNGTLQDLSHWDLALNEQAEAALVSAEYSHNEGATWTNSTIEVERDPSIRFCTGSDVLKFNTGSTGGEPTYFRATFNADMTVNNFATSWVKTGGGQQGCNLYYYSGMGARLD
jgi:hypothetical protein